MQKEWPSLGTLTRVVVTRRDGHGEWYGRVETDGARRHQEERHRLRRHVPLEVRPALELVPLRLRVAAPRRPTPAPDTARPPIYGTLAGDRRRTTRSSGVPAGRGVRRRRRSRPQVRQHGRIFWSQATGAHERLQAGAQGLPADAAARRVEARLPADQPAQGRAGKTAGAPSSTARITVAGTASRGEGHASRPERSACLWPGASVAHMVDADDVRRVGAGAAAQLRGVHRPPLEAEGAPARLRRLLPRRDLDGVRLPQGSSATGWWPRTPRRSSCRRPRTCATSGCAPGSTASTRRDARAGHRRLAHVRAQMLHDLVDRPQPLAAAWAAMDEERWAELSCCCTPTCTGTTATSTCAVVRRCSPTCATHRRRDHLPTWRSATGSSTAGRRDPGRPTWVGTGFR